MVGTAPQLETDVQQKVNAGNRRFSCSMDYAASVCDRQPVSAALSLWYQDMLCASSNQENQSHRCDYHGTSGMKMPSQARTWGNEDLEEVDVNEITAESDDELSD